jgi:hypothetical protein
MAYTYKYGNFTYKFGTPSDENPIRSYEPLSIFVYKGDKIRKLYLKIGRTLLPVRKYGDNYGVDMKKTKFDLSKERQLNRGYSKIVGLPSSEITKALRDDILKSFKKRYAQFILQKPLTKKQMVDVKIALKESIKRMKEAEKNTAPDTKRIDGKIFRLASQPYLTKKEVLIRQENAKKRDYFTRIVKIGNSSYLYVRENEEKSRKKYKKKESILLSKIAKAEAREKTILAKAEAKKKMTPAKKKPTAKKKVVRKKVVAKKK